MSFVSANDFVALPQFAWHVYTALRDAPKDYNALSDDVLALQQVLFRAEDNMTKMKRGLEERELEQLRDIARGCKRVLEEVEALLKGCNLTNRGVTWGRVKFAAEDTVLVRSRLSAQVNKLNVFNGLLILSSQNRTEEKLDKVIATLKRRGSVISVDSMADVLHEDQGWCIFGRALEDEGITLQMAQDRHHSFIRLLAAAVGREAASNHITNSEEDLNTYDSSQGSPAAAVGGEETNNHNANTEEALNTPDSFRSSFGAEIISGSARSSFDESTPKMQREIKDLEPGVQKGLVVTGILDKIQNQPLYESDSSRSLASPAKRRTSSTSSSSSIMARGYNLLTSRHRLDNASFQAAIEAIAETKRKPSLDKDLWSSSVKTSVQYNPIDFENVLRLHPATCVADTMYGQAQRMALRFAAFFGIVELLVILLCSDTKIDASTVSGKIPLHIAIYGDYAGVVKNLLRKNIDMSFRDLRDWLLLRSEGHHLPSSAKRSCSWYQNVTNSDSFHQHEKYDCGSSFCVALLSNKVEAFDLAGTQPSTIAVEWLGGHGHDLSALQSNATCTSSDAIKAASYVLEYWHDQGICQILQAKFPKSQNPLRGVVSIRARPNRDTKMRLPYLKPKQKCHRCLSLLKLMEDAILQSWSPGQTYASLKESYASPGWTALTIALDVHSKLLLNELIDHGSKIIAAQQIKVNFEGLGLA